MVKRASASDNKGKADSVVREEIVNALLFQRFAFCKPIELEDLTEGMGDEVVVLRDKTILRMDREAESRELAEILSKAKLGEADPLLATFFFQNDITPQEGRYASIFFRLCQPLQNAWVYKTMRKWVPDIYEAEIAELMMMWEASLTGTLKDNGDPEIRQLYLSIFTILSENPANNIQLVLQTDQEYRADWERYIDTLRKLVQQEPNADLFLSLPLVTNAPYLVQIITDKDGFRHYEVKSLKKVAV